MSKKILFVDDDPNLLAAFARNLRKHFTFDTAGNGPEAIQRMRAGEPYAVIVCDMRMPGMDGVKVLECARSICPDTVRVMLTGNADQQTAVDAVNRGQIYRFLNKPCPPDQMIPVLEQALRQYDLVHLEREILENTLAGGVRALSEVLGMIAPDAHHRGLVMRDHIRTFAAAANAGPAWELVIAAQLAPIGFASVPANVLRKVSARTPLHTEEEAMIQRVPQVGHDLLKDIPRLDGVASIVLYQDKRYDGAGFPGDFVSGAEIPVGARLLKILHDRWALEKEGVVRRNAQDTMAERAGCYDPELLSICFTCIVDRMETTRGSDKPPLAISIGEISPGQLLARDILTKEGLVLVSSGNRLTPLTVERIRNLAELGDVCEPFMISDVPIDTSEVLAGAGAAGGS